VLGAGWSALATPALNPNAVTANAETIAAPAPILFALTLKSLLVQQYSLPDPVNMLARSVSAGYLLWARN